MLALHPFGHKRGGSDGRTATEGLELCILDDAFLNSSTAVCVPKGRPAALAYVSEFIEEAKVSGLVRKALDEMGLTSSQIAPAGMKP